MKKYSIDIGSSTLKFAQMNEDGSLECRDFATALACYFEGSRINDAGIKRLLDACSAALLCVPESERASVKVAATAAMRKASNALEICQQLREVCGINCQIISQQKEAELSYKAAAAFCGAGFSALLDIGGASSELSSAAGCEMFDFGLLNLSAKNGDYRDEIALLARKISPEFYSYFCSAREAFSSMKYASAQIHCTSKALIYAQTGAKNYEINDYLFANKSVFKAQLLDLAREILAMSEAEKFWRFDAQSAADSPAPSQRAPAIFRACAICCALGFSEFIACPYSLKDALLLE